MALSDSPLFRWMFPAHNDDAQRVVSDLMRPVDAGVALESYLGHVDDASGLPNTPEGLWRTQPNVRKVVDFIARTVGSVPFHAYELRDNSDRRRVRDGALADSLRSPGGVSPVRFWHGVVADRLLYDAWVVMVGVGGDGRPALQRIPASKVRFSFDGLGTVKGVEFSRRNDRAGKHEWVELDMSALVFDVSYRPDGMAPFSGVKTLWNVLEEARQARHWRRQVWANGARMSGWVERPYDPGIEQWTDEDRTRFERKLVADYTGDGPKSGGWPVIEDGMKLHSMSAFSAIDMQDLEARRLSAIEVAAAFHIAPELVGAQQGNYSNVREYRQMLYRDSLGPYIDEVEQALNAQLVPMLGDSRDLYVEAHVDAKLRGSFEERAQIMQTATGAPWLSINEARALDNRPSLGSGYDEPVQPLNVLYGGQSSPTDSGSQNVNPLKAFPMVLGAKAAPYFSRSVKAYRSDLAKFVARQESAVLSRLGAKAAGELGEAWDGDRWDRELSDLVARHTKRVAALRAALVAGRLGVEFDDEWMDGWLTEAASKTASAWNDATRGALSEVMSSADWKDAAVNVFAVAGGARAGLLAVSTATDASNFAANDVAKRVGGEVVKVWRTTSGNSRSSHSSMDGEETPVGETFSNGARWPGDAVLPDEERANCQCEIEFVRRSA